MLVVDGKPMKVSLTVSKDQTLDLVYPRRTELYQVKLFTKKCSPLHRVDPAAAISYAGST